MDNVSELYMRGVIFRSSFFMLENGIKNNKLIIICNQLKILAEILCRTKINLYLYPRRILGDAVNIYFYTIRWTKSPIYS